VISSIRVEGKLNVTNTNAEPAGDVLGERWGIGNACRRTVATEWRDSNRGIVVQQNASSGEDGITSLSRCESSQPRSSCSVTHERGGGSEAVATNGAGDAAVECSGGMGAVMLATADATDSKRSKPRTNRLNGGPRRYRGDHVHRAQHGSGTAKRYWIDSPVLRRSHRQLMEEFSSWL
jgi:hypothetical protein